MFDGKVYLVLFTIVRPGTDIFFCSLDHFDTILDDLHQFKWSSLGSLEILLRKQSTAFKYKERGAAVAQWIHPAATGSNPKHTIYTFLKKNFFSKRFKHKKDLDIKISHYGKIDFVSTGPKGDTYAKDKLSIELSLTDTPVRLPFGVVSRDVSHLAIADAEVSIASTVLVLALTLDVQKTELVEFRFCKIDCRSLKL